MMLPRHSSRALGRPGPAAAAALLFLTAGCRVDTAALPLPPPVEGEVLSDGSWEVYDVGSGAERLWLFVEACELSAFPPVIEFAAAGWSPSAGFLVPEGGLFTRICPTAGCPPLCTTGSMRSITIREASWGALFTQRSCSDGLLLPALPDGTNPVMYDYVRARNPDRRVDMEAGDAVAVGGRVAAVYPSPPPVQAVCPSLSDTFALSTFDLFDPSTLVPDNGDPFFPHFMPPGVALGSLEPGWLAVRELVAGPAGELLVFYARVDSDAPEPDDAETILATGEARAVAVSLDGVIARPDIAVSGLVGFVPQDIDLRGEEVTVAGVDPGGAVRVATFTLWSEAEAPALLETVEIQSAYQPASILGVFADPEGITVVWHEAVYDDAGIVRAAHIEDGEFPAPFELGRVGAGLPWARRVGNDVFLVYHLEPIDRGPRTFYVARVGD